MQYHVPACNGQRCASGNAGRAEAPAVGNTVIGNIWCGDDCFAEGIARAGCARLLRRRSGVGVEQAALARSEIRLRVASSHGPARDGFSVHRGIAGLPALPSLPSTGARVRPGPGRRRHGPAAGRVRPACSRSRGRLAFQRVAHLGMGAGEAPRGPCRHPAAGGRRSAPRSFGVPRGCGRGRSSVPASQADAGRRWHSSKSAPPLVWDLAVPVTAGERWLAMRAGWLRVHAVQPTLHLQFSVAGASVAAAWLGVGRCASGDGRRAARGHHLGGGGLGPYACCDSGQCDAGHVAGGALAKVPAPLLEPWASLTAPAVATWARPALARRRGRRGCRTAGCRRAVVPTGGSTAAGHGQAQQRAAGTR
jgi:hypothetical protein